MTVANNLHECRASACVLEEAWADVLPEAADADADGGTRWTCIRRIPAEFAAAIEASIGLLVECIFADTESVFWHVGTSRWSPRSPPHCLPSHPLQCAQPAPSDALAGALTVSQGRAAGSAV